MRALWFYWTLLLSFFGLRPRPFGARADGRAFKVTIHGHAYVGTPLTVGAFREFARDGCLEAIGTLNAAASNPEVTPTMAAQGLEAAIRVAARALGVNENWVARSMTTAEVAVVVALVLVGSGLENVAGGSGGPKAVKP